MWSRRGRGEFFVFFLTFFLEGSCGGVNVHVCVLVWAGG